MNNISIGGKIFTLTEDLAAISIHVKRKGGVWSLLPYGHDALLLHLGDIQPKEVEGKFVFEVRVGATVVVVTVAADGAEGTLFYDQMKHNRTMTIPMRQVADDWSPYAERLAEEKRVGRSYLSETVRWGIR